MTDPAGLDLDFNLSLCQRFGSVFKGLKRGTRFHGGKGSDSLHRIKVIDGMPQARSFPLSPQMSHGDEISLYYAMFAKPMKINPSTIAGLLAATMVVGFLCGLVYVVNYLLSQR
jgi:hypothetical protein